MKEHLKWYRRRRLPHFDDAGAIQFVTYRLADSLPKKWKDNRKIDFRQIDLELSRGLGNCILKDQNNAKTVIDFWLSGHEKQFDLIAWTVMPNHVHVLFKQRLGNRLGDIMRYQKSKSAREINERIWKNGALWQRGYWDRFIRNEAHLDYCVDYILENSIKAGLAASSEEWPWSGVIEDLEVVV